MRRLVPPPRGRALPLTPLLAAGETIFLADVLGHRSARADHLAEALDGGGVVGGVLQARGAETPCGVWVLLVGPGDRWDDVLLSGVAWDCDELAEGDFARMGQETNPWCRPWPYQRGLRPGGTCQTCYRCFSRGVG